MQARLLASREKSLEKMSDKITKANLAKRLVGALRLTPEELEDYAS
jgi:hypothetical protein